MKNLLPRALQPELLQSLRFFPVVSILGPRQVGKTTLARQLEGHFDKPVIYLDLEDMAVAQRLENPDFFLEPYRDQLIILDEIHRHPAIFPHLRAMIDRHRVPGRFVVLGSASLQLMQNTSESLAGRIASLHLHPMSLDELPDEIGMMAHWLHGGFPEPLLARDDAFSAQWRGNFLRTFIERDLPLYGLSFFENPQLKPFLAMLAQSQGNLFNAESLGRSLGVSGPVVRRFMHYLTQAYLIEPLQPWFVNASKRLVKSPKIYFGDTGLLHSLLGIGSLDALRSSPVCGASWEGYVIGQVRHCLKNPDGSAFFYRTHEGAEVDLVLVQGITPWTTIEVKLGETPALTKGYHSAIKDLGAPNNWLITTGTESYPLREGIEVLSLAEAIRRVRAWSAANLT